MKLSYVYDIILTGTFENEEEAMNPKIYLILLCLITIGTLFVVYARPTLFGRWKNDKKENWLEASFLFLWVATGAAGYFIELTKVQGWLQNSVFAISLAGTSVWCTIQWLNSRPVNFDNVLHK